LLWRLGWRATHDTYLATKFRAAGFVIVGKTNLPELASAATTEPDLRPARGSGPRRRRTTPAPQRLPASCTALVWAAPRSLATTRGMLSAPQGTEMFQFPHLPPPRLCVQRGVTDHDVRRVAPFGYRRCVACLRPTVAFRSLPRPSSARVAEASTAYRFLLEDNGPRCPAKFRSRLA